jgi:pimeloyl-ACP methyl ester carboxylesterase
MAEARISTVARDGLEFDVRDDGPLDGEPVVLLHGFPERATSWRYVTPILNAAGYRTLAMDQRGYAPGARPSRRRGSTAAELAADVAALIDEAGGSAHVVGHDWGSAVAWALAMTEPGRVRTLTAVSVPHPKAFLESWVKSTQGLKSWYMAFFQLPAVPELLAARGLFGPWLRQAGMSRDDVARFRTEVLDDGAFHGGLMWYRALPFSRPGDLDGEVTVPTTLVWSDEDVAIGRWPVDRTAEYVAAPYELVVLAGVSHWIPTEAPDALADAILARVRG